jgi:Tol biopolymer transport system component
VRAPTAVLAAAAALALAAPAQARIAYDKGPAGLHPHVFVAADDGTHQRRLASGMFPHISPNGRSVAYTRPNFKTANQQLRLIGAGGGRSRLVARGFDIGETHWAPDSRFVAAQLGRGIVVYDVRTHKSKLIRGRRFSGFSFSPDSRSIVFGRRPRASLNAPSDLYVASRSGRGTRRLTRNGRSLNPLWTRQGIVFDEQTVRKNDAPAYDLFFVRPDGSGARRITTTTVPRLASGLVPHAASADGSHVVADFSEQDEVETYAVDVASGAARKLGTFLLPAGISRDGSTIVAATNGPDPGAHHDIVAVPFGAGPLRLLVPGGADPDWTG